jgi:large repetitive protein
VGAIKVHLAILFYRFFYLSIFAFTQRTRHGKLCMRLFESLLVFHTIATLFFSVSAVAQEDQTIIQKVAGQQIGSIDVDRLELSLDKYGIIDVESGKTDSQHTYDIHLSLGYIKNPLILTTRSGITGATRQNSLIKHRFGGYLSGSYAFFDWMRLGAEMPMAFLQTGDPFPVSSTLTNNLFPIAIGDLRLVPKFQLLRAEKAFVDFAIIPQFTIPVGLLNRLTTGGHDNYMGDGFFTASPQLAVSRDFGFGLRTAANIGFLFRLPSTMANINQGEELIYKVGLGYRFHPIGLPISLDLSMNGSLLLWPNPGLYQNPHELLYSTSFDLFDFQLYVAAGSAVPYLQRFPVWTGPASPDLRILSGLRYAPRCLDKDQDGICKEEDLCPHEAEDFDGFNDRDGCHDFDNDEDGVVDQKDECPNEKEDLDEFEDLDGCPDPDNDLDGMLDAQDQCPNEKEDIDAFEDDDGCPEPDNDQDGILDGDDLCVNQPELVNGINDIDGCPELDSDDDSILDLADLCPDTPEDIDQYQDEDGCPDPDNDQDKIEDTVDQCPNDAEDPDYFQDEDGCPDLDNDGDKILDAVDQCPNEPEVINSVKDEDGCPDEAKIVFENNRIRILEKVYFSRGRATIKTASFSLLNQVAKILASNLQITKVQIEGHTDSQGSARYNRRLSDKRAKAIKRYLEKKNVAPERLVAIGYGEDQPIESNDTKEGRQANRRVVFRVLEINGEPIPEDSNPESVEEKGVNQ